MEEMSMSIPSESIPLVNSADVDWQEHPRVKNVFMKTLLTAADNPLANFNLVKVPVGGLVTRHLHVEEVETIYMLAGKSELILGEQRIPFHAGTIVAIPKGLEHELINVGEITVELLTIFTPPLT
jgi:quercetin dioxygenase-like cupin family protein